VSLGAEKRPEPLISRQSSNPDEGICGEEAGRGKWNK